MWYKTGVRTLLLKSRTKDGGEKTTDRKSLKFISKNHVDFDNKLEILKNEKEKCDVPCRIYSSVNSRDVRKAIRLFRKKQFDVETENLENQFNFYNKAYNHFFSCLSRPESAETKLFLIDIDYECNTRTLSSLFTEFTNVIEVRRTINGYHIITEPFNPSLAPGFEIKKDDMILHI